MGSEMSSPVIVRMIAPVLESTTSTTTGSPGHEKRTTPISREAGHLQEPATIARPIVINIGVPIPDFIRASVVEVCSGPLSRSTTVRHIIGGHLGDTGAEERIGVRPQNPYHLRPPRRILTIPDPISQFSPQCHSPDEGARPWRVGKHPRLCSREYAERRIEPTDRFQFISHRDKQGCLRA